jgi:low affinity Fe/Cu permease
LLLRLRRVLNRHMENLGQWFGNAAGAVATAAGKPLTFILAVLVVIVWGICGPVFGYSDTWQLIINTGTTIITFLMVFLIQNSQNREGAALQVKLDELIRVSNARNALVGLEHLSESEIEKIRLASERRAKAAQGGEKAVRQTNRKANRAAKKA